MDTLEKYVPPERYADQDAELGRAIEREYAGLDVGWEDVCALAFLGRGGKGKEDLPDSSLRHMLRVDRSVDQCAAESYLLAASGRATAPIPLGHERVPSDVFYRAVERRVRDLQEG
jgi:hypothetical protein